MNNEQFRKMKDSQNCTDLIVEAVLKKCIDIYNEIHKETKNLDENIYGRFPLAAYIEQQRTIPGKTKLSSVRDTIDIWKYEGEELCRDVIVPAPVVSKMYYDRAHFTFEIMENKVRFAYQFGPRYGRSMEFDIVKTSDIIQIANEKCLWVS